MIPNKAITNVQTGTKPLNSIAMGIDKTSLAFIMDMFTNLYSDIWLAVVREYSTNAADSHLRAGVKLPIDIKFSETSFSVTDYGLGMSRDEIENVYSMYGASTKRDDADANGMFGVGAKCALGAVDSFTVTSVQDNMSTVAQITKDVDGPKMTILSHVKTNRGNGTTVTLPISSREARTLEDKLRGFFKYWRGVEYGEGVLINGKTHGEFFSDELGLDALLKLDDDFYLSGSHYPQIVMGGVAYPVKQLDGVATKYRYCSPIAYVPVGAVDFTPSREDLMYTDRTKETIRDIFQYVNTYGPKIAAQRIAEAPTPFDKFLAIEKWGATAKAATPTVLDDKGYGGAHPKMVKQAHGRVNMWKSVDIGSTPAGSWKEFATRANNDEATTVLVVNFPYNTMNDERYDTIVEHLVGRNSSFNMGHMFHFKADGRTSTKVTNKVKYEHVVDAEKGLDYWKREIVSSDKKRIKSLFDRAGTKIFNSFPVKIVDYKSIPKAKTERKVKKLSEYTCLRFTPGSGTGIESVVLNEEELVALDHDNIFYLETPSKLGTGKSSYDNNQIRTEYMRFFELHPDAVVVSGVNKKRFNKFERLIPGVIERTMDKSLSRKINAIADGISDDVVTYHESRGKYSGASFIAHMCHSLYGSATKSYDNFVDELGEYRDEFINKYGFAKETVEAHEKIITDYPLCGSWILSRVASASAERPCGFLADFPMAKGVLGDLTRGRSEWYPGDLKTLTEAGHYCYLVLEHENNKNKKEEK